MVDPNNPNNTYKEPVLGFFLLLKGCQFMIIMNRPPAFGK
jgi:hypothetical protein